MSLPIYERNINFVGYRRLWYLISLLVIVPGMIALALHGLNLGIDFTGGNLLQVKFAKEVEIVQVRGVMEDLHLGRMVQQAGVGEFLIRTPELSEQDNARLRTTLQEKIGTMEVLRNEKVGAVVGKELTHNAYLALAIASVLMLIYITVRFEYRFALAAIIALLHDVLVTLGFFALFRIEVDSAFVAALLTIIGYSINDTIVIFDRIRENLGLLRKEPIQEVVNRSICQTLVRSIATVSTVIMALVALMVLGGETTKVFALAMLVGTVCGCYSSIFNASPLWVDLTNLTQKKRLSPARATAR
ncbi:MAG: protein translocase subunit SecF [Clostridia bacterium]|nr:MAG: protein translocase subunit SecF [Clostridia bacterium]